jgi:primosomal protein N' (replication factor Y) (superfamily II helicase)
VKSPFPIICAKCSWSKIEPVGIGIQQVEEHLEKILGKSYSIIRLDSDTPGKVADLYEGINVSDIVLSTNIGGSIIHQDIGAVIWLSFEVNLSIPSYHIEEDIYDEISYYKKQGVDIYIQTYTPDHPLLREIMDGNTRSFISMLSRERKSFGYPPYGEVVTLRIHDESQKKVADIMTKMIHKIGIIKKPSTFFAFDTDIRERSHGEWQQKIILKDTDLSYILRDLEVEIVRNRSVTLQRD